MKRLEFTSGVSNVFSSSLPVAAPFPDKGKTFFLGREGEGAGCGYPYRSYRRFGCFMELLDMNTAAAIIRVELIKGFHCEKLQCSRHQTTDMKNHFFSYSTVNQMPHASLVRFWLSFFGEKKWYIWKHWKRESYRKKGNFPV